MQRCLSITTCALVFALAWLVAGPLAAQEEQEEAAQAEKEQGTEEVQAEEAEEPRRRGRESGSEVWRDNPTIV